MPEPTFQDLLDTYSEDLFVGRTEELALFEHMIAANRPPCLILAISGQGGVGKTTLLERFRSMAGDRNIATAVADEGQLGVIEVLDHLAGQFGRDGVPFDTFMKRLQRYRELKQQIDADKDAPRGFLDFAARGAARMGMRAFKKHVPIAGDFADVMLSKEAEDRIAEETGTFATYVAQKFKQRDDRNLVLDTTKELTGQFLIDLSMQAQYRRIVLFFDTYEQTAPVLDGWLRDLLRGQYGDFHGNTRVVIAGRHPLGQQWTRFRGAVRQIELREFSEDEARQYLERSGIVERVEQDQFVQLSNRLPVLLAFLLSAPGSVPTEVAGTAVERFLQGFTPSERETALLSSVPRYFNQDILQAVLASETAVAAFDWLTNQPFVRETERGWAYHDVVRTMLVRSLRHRSPGRYAYAHTQLAELYTTPSTNSAKTDLLHHANSLWRRRYVEAAYHRLASDPERHLDFFLSALISVVHADLVFLDSDIDQSEMALFADMLRSVFDETGSPALEVWAERITGLANTDVSSNPLTPVAHEALRTLFTPLATRSTLGDYERSFSYLVLSSVSLGQESLVDALSFASRAIELQPTDGYGYYLRGLTYYKLKDYGAALADFSKSIELQPNDGDNYAWRAKTHGELGNDGAALLDFSTAIQLQPNDGDIYYARGLIHFQREDYPAALIDFSKAIDIQPKVGDNYLLRGSVYIKLNDYRTALIDFSSAIELQPSNANALALRGDLHLQLEDFAGALIDFSKAIELQPDRGRHHALRGKARFQLDDYSGALIDFSKAIELQPDNGLNYFFRGRLYSELHDYSAALADFSRAIELQPNDGHHFHWRASTYMQLEEYGAALADFSQAILLQPTAADTYALRGSIEYLLKDYSAALADFSKAIELQPGAADAYAARGSTNSRLKDYSVALADFSKAIELQPGVADNYTLRGSTHLLLKDLPAALADFSKAIELQPDGVFNYQWRGQTYYVLENYAAALADFSKGIELLPDNAYSYQWRGRISYELEDYAAALADLSRAIELESDNPFTHARRARAQAALGNTLSAVADLQRTEELLADDGKPAYIAAACYIQLDRIDDALRLLYLAFRRSPELMYGMVTDSDSEIVRLIPEFQTLVAEFQCPTPSTQDELTTDMPPPGL